MFCFHLFRAFLYGWLLCLLVSLLGASWTARGRWWRWRTSGTGGGLSMCCLLLAGLAGVVLCALCVLLSPGTVSISRYVNSHDYHVSQCWSYQQKSTDAEWWIELRNKGKLMIITVMYVTLAAMRWKPKKKINLNFTNLNFFHDCLHCVHKCNDHSCLYIFLRSANIWSFIIIIIHLN